MYSSNDAIDDTAAILEATPEVQAVLALVQAAAANGEFTAEIPTSTMDSLSDDQKLLITRFLRFSLYVDSQQKNIISWKTMWIPTT